VAGEAAGGEHDGGAPERGCQRWLKSVDGRLLNRLRQGVLDILGAAAGLEVPLGLLPPGARFQVLPALRRHVIGVGLVQVSSISQAVVDG
jgi:hypothetical protein